jgi:hypothetical protein
MGGKGGGKGGGNFGNFGNFGGMGGGALTTRVSGRDILFILEQAQYDSRRTRGR